MAWLNSCMLFKAVFTSIDDFRHAGCSPIGLSLPVDSRACGRACVRICICAQVYQHALALPSALLLALPKALLLERRSVSPMALQWLQTTKVK